MSEMALKPEHKVCEQNVSAPAIIVVRITPETDTEAAHFEVETDPSQPLRPDQRREVNIQWFGEAAGHDLADWQFRFPIAVSVDDLHWFGRPENFRVVFLGPVRRWVNPAAVSDMAASFTEGNLDGMIAWVTSSHYGTRQSEGMGPASFAFPMSIMLADGIFGIIKPRFFCDLTVMDRTKEEFKRTAR